MTVLGIRERDLPGTGFRGAALTVRGGDGLRVVDASVIPTVISTTIGDVDRPNFRRPCRYPWGGHRTRSCRLRPTPGQIGELIGSTHDVVVHLLCCQFGLAVLERVEDVQVFGVKVGLVSYRTAERYRGV